MTTKIISYLINEEQKMHKIGFHKSLLNFVVDLSF